MHRAPLALSLSKGHPDPQSPSPLAEGRCEGAAPMW